VHRESIIYIKPTRYNSGSIVFITNYKYAVHVSDALSVHHSTVRCAPTLNIYKGFIPTQIMTNTTGCCYSL